MNDGNNPQFHDVDATDDGQDDISDSAQNSAPLSSIRRACDACRTRKIRCDRNSPCSHCIHAKIACTHVNKGPKEKRTRILLSVQYERKIDLIDRRLEGVTRLLEEIKTTIPVANAQLAAQGKDATPDRTSQPSGSSTSTPFSLAMQLASNSPIIEAEAESSLAAHSIFAEDFLQNVIGSDSLQSADLEMRKSLDSLHCIVDALKQQTAGTEMVYTMANYVSRPTLSDIKLPPIQKTVALIHEFKGKYSNVATWIFDVCPLDDFSEICLRIYVSKDFSEADFIISNIGMMYLFQELSCSTDKEENLSYFEMCRINVETALGNLPLHLPANQTMIAALVLGSYYAIEISKPSLSWTLVSKASELCQTLGYHRLSSLKDQVNKSDRKQFLFWFVYFMDKSLSLRLGRVSTIQDWDVSVPMPSIQDVHITPLSAFFAMWIKTARCQGDIYEKLYSPDSVSQPNHVRVARVAAITGDLEEIRKQTSEVTAEWFNQASTKIGAPMVQLMSLSDDVLRLSLLTLAYRATRSPESTQSTFVPECIEAARATLQRHQQYMACLQSTVPYYFPSYVHWTLMFAPFTPFIVLFCQVIETRDQRDLTSLYNFVNSTESAPMVSDAAAKMHRLFQVLYAVAFRFVEFRNSTPPANQSWVNAECNPCINTLGIVSMDPGQRQQQQMAPVGDNQGLPVFGYPPGQSEVLDAIYGQGGANSMMWMNNTEQLEDWFNSNQQILEMVEVPDFNYPQQT
ncbi:hypothetical protein BKA56DRAFT_493048 [Ilyonectria sp. MPI-CAGE-AT-0026]|nr:hypothetical protein BKA56DRAFT_493048 [Ilyonectria sp. MPI-CAGE-AT-0026]